MAFEAEAPYASVGLVGPESAYVVQAAPHLLRADLQDYTLCAPPTAPHATSTVATPQGTTPALTTRAPAPPTTLAPLPPIATLARYTPVVGPRGCFSTDGSSVFLDCGSKGVTLKRSKGVRRTRAKGRHCCRNLGVASPAASTVTSWTPKARRT
jgi:hypothetical protein